MSLLQRIHDRLTGVLGRDCNGKPLRVGDMVEPGPSARSSTPICGRMVILGVEDHHYRPGIFWRRAVHLLDADGSHVYAKTTNCLRRVDEPPREATWEDVAEVTGWKPRVVEQPSEVPA